MKNAECFPRGFELPTQSPLYWVGQKDRYLRQLLIKDIEALTSRRLVVYFANRYSADADIDDADCKYLTELLGDIGSEPVDLLIETNGGKTDSAEAIISLLQTLCPGFRTIVANAAKSNGTLISLAGSSIVMGPTSELGPIDPHITGIPCTILAEPQVAQSNYALHKLAILALKQTQSLAGRLLLDGMLSTTPERVNEVVAALATRDTYFSHGSVIDSREAASLGLSVESLPPGDPLWERIWLLYVMYDFDVKRDGYLKVFEGRARSTAISLNNSSSK